MVRVQEDEMLEIEGDFTHSVRELPRRTSIVKSILNIKKMSSAPYSYTAGTNPSIY